MWSWKSETPSEMTALIIDDDAKLADLVGRFLQNNGWRVFTAGDGDAGLALLEKEKPALVILDVMLPGKDGFEICRDIRSRSGIPILMLTARGGIDDRLQGLETGADDYLPKPFEPRELLARLRSLHRRGNHPAPVEDTPQRQYGSLRIDHARREAHIDGKLVMLTTMEFNALWLFAQRPGEVLSRDAIMDALRGMGWSAFDRSIDILMSRLRQKLGDDPKQPRFIKTIWGEGYVFIASPGDRS